MNNKCEFCNKSFSTKSNLKAHQKNAKYCLEIQKSKEIKIEERIREKVMKEYEFKMYKQKEEYERKIEKLEATIKELSLEAIKRPTKISNTTNNVLNLTPFDMDDADMIKDKISQFYNLEYFMKGKRGVAEFTKDKLLLDNDGKLKYVCSDPSRMIFKYKDKDGQVRKDLKATRLSKKVTPDILTKAAKIKT